LKGIESVWNNKLVVEIIPILETEKWPNEGDENVASETEKFHY
jgi:hypothetical protein